MEKLFIDKKYALHIHCARKASFAIVRGKTLLSNQPTDQATKIEVKGSSFHVLFNNSSPPFLWFLY